MLARLERARDKTNLFCLREQGTGALGVRSSRNRQGGVNREFRELTHALHAIELALYLAIQSDPLEAGRGGNGSKAKYQTIDQRGREQGLRRPLVTRASELRGRLAWKRGQARRLETHGAGDPRRGADRINVWKRVHKTSEIIH
ncbi:MAG: hypothetical protein RL245_1581 [Pseudomonadota bacterium]